MSGTGASGKHAEIAAMLRRWSLPVPTPAPAWQAAEFDRFGDARVVLLGEATHGSAEFYRARAAITRRLIERHGFIVVAVEADWPDAATIDDHVRRGAPIAQAFGRFPTWMWRNREVADQFDAFVWYEETTAVTPTGVPEPAGSAEEVVQDR